MPPYHYLHLQHFFMVIGLGVVFAVAIVLARGSRIFHLGRHDINEKRENHEFGGQVTEGRNPVPLFIWLVIAGYMVWAIGYVLYCAVVGVQ
jgi:hypothetical protein